MSFKIEQVGGMRKAYAAKLIELGIHTTDELLDRAATPADRAKLFEESAIPEEEIVKWAEHADLMRLTGVDSRIAELLEAVGVKSVKDLRDRDAADLFKKMTDANKAKNYTSSVPTEAETGDMIAESKVMDDRLKF